MKQTTYSTFWDIIANNRIEIPVIQRDYTYGRKSASVIRRKLVNDISEAIINDSSINLDFVYGKILGKDNENNCIRNKENIESLLKSIEAYAAGLDIDIDYKIENEVKKTNELVSFIPLDGQQRLTTLFLFHWYLAQSGNKTNELKLLKKFSYSTRNSSKDFCEMICSKEFNIIGEIDSVSEIIANNNQYFSIWEKDPTVFSMLVVIDEIHSSLREHLSEIEKLWVNLNSNISFDFFDLEHFDQTDDLYIKMNARGKHLSHFENFKAWLIKNKSDDISVDSWKKKFDIKWNDLFWKHKSKSNYKIDDEFLQYFKLSLLANYLQKVKIEDPGLNEEKDISEYNAENWSLDDLKSIIAFLRKKESNPLELFNACDEFRNNIDNYLSTLDYLDFDLDNDTNEIVNKYIKCTLSEFIFGEKVHNYNWWDISFHYAITRYLVHLGGCRNHFKEWIRVSSNLIYNTKIDSPKLYIEAINSIQSLISKMSCDKSVYDTLASFSSGDINFFSLTQREEEIKKSILINKDRSWERVFIKSENHSYFFGQIGFIFKLDGLSNEKNIFENNYKKVSALFSEDVLNEQTYLLTRAFLTQGDCFYHDGENRIFNSNVRGTLRNRNENWRRFFDKHIRFISEIINHSNFNESDVLGSLNIIITKDDYKIKGEYFSKYIENYKLFEYSKRNFIRKCGVGYYPLNSTRMSGYFVELNTYDWYLRNQESLKNKHNGLDIKYNYVKGVDSEPSVELIYGNTSYKIELDSKSGEFVLKYKSQIEKFNSIELALDKILNNVN